MSTDAIAVILLGGFVVLCIAVDDLAHSRRRRRQQARDTENHRRLMAELKRQP